MNNNHIYQSDNVLLLDSISRIYNQGNNEIKVLDNVNLSVKKGEIVDVPMKLSFQMIGEDEDNSLEKSKNIAIKFLHPDSKCVSG